ncbi:MAG: type II toxin-antitoxin system RelE/ParE family toxin, partial [Candidatus Omnitrophica bacterium]|nr:type II toxin-antitoxin system RelE/ParE family toxin [Candidatus Omnitrophota bacterium]
NRLKAVYYFIDQRRDCPVKEFIKALPVRERAKIFAYINALKKEGNNLRRPMADYLGSGIYELRPKDNRIFYFFYLKDFAVLLHAIKKKTWRISENDLNLYLKRKELTESGYKHIEELE